MQPQCTSKVAIANRMSYGSCAVGGAEAMQALKELRELKALNKADVSIPDRYWRPFTSKVVNILA